MISTSEIKFIQSLRHKKYRDKNNVFVAEGEKIVSELFNSNLQTKAIYALPSWIDRHSVYMPASVECKQIKLKELERISLQKTPNQVLAVVNKPNCIITGDIIKKHLVLILDKLQDPGNLGTIIRTADWFGIRHIICAPGTADVFNPKVIQASMGSFMRVNISYTKPNLLLQDISGLNPVYGSFLEGQNLYKTKIKTPAVLIIGNESQGISAGLAQYVTQKITIPPHHKNCGCNKAESLNAAVAAGIIMAQLRNNSNQNPG